MRLTSRTRQDASSSPNEIWRVNWRAEGYAFCGIYVISPDNRWPSKIGVSQNPVKRLIGLQTACWKKLDIAEYKYAVDFAAARLVEQMVHQILKDDGKLMYGEWFDLKPDKAMEVIDFAALQLNIELRSDVPDLKIQEKTKKYLLKDMRRAVWAEKLTC